MSRKTLLLVVWGSIFLLLTGCGKEIAEPSEERLFSTFQFELPSYWKLISFKKQMTKNIGNKVRPVYKSKFKADVLLEVPVYNLDRAALAKYVQLKNTIKNRFGEILDNDISFIKQISEKGEVRQVVGIATSTYVNGGWNMKFKIENVLFSTMGTPASFFDQKNAIITGTAQAKKFFNDLEKKIQVHGDREREENKKREQILKKQNEDRKFKALITYDYGKEPKLKIKPEGKSFAATNNLTQSPFLVKVMLLREKDYSVKTRDARPSGTSKREAGAEKIHIRTLLMNPSTRSFKNVKICIQHFIYDKPYTVKQTYYRKRSYSKVGVKEYIKKFYKLEYIPPNQKLVFDTSGIALNFSKSQFIDDAYDRSRRGLDDTYKSESGEEYAGAIVSIFYKDKLIYQETNNRTLRDKGIKEMPY